MDIPVVYKYSIHGADWDSHSGFKKHTFPAGSIRDDRIFINVGRYTVRPTDLMETSPVLKDIFFEAKLRSDVSRFLLLTRYVYQSING